jgi:acid phosphatase type 7
MKTIRGRFRAAVLMGAAVSVLSFVAGAKAQDRNSNDNSWQHDDSWQSDNQWSNGNQAPHDNPWPYNKLQRSPVLAVVGDVACQPGGPATTGGQTEKENEVCGGDTVQNLIQSQAATAQQIENMKPDLVALVGDEQYQVGQYSDFENSYESTYGAFKFITRPAPGNHEFYTEHGAIGVAGYGYFSYFNGVQHCLVVNANCTHADGSVEMTTITDPKISNVYQGSTTVASSGGTFTSPVPFSDGQAGHFEQTGGLGTASGGAVGVGDGWYSYDLGSWHLISLNIECENQQGGCSETGSWFASELEWLKKDLAENHSACTLAYWHQPTFSAANGLSLEGATAQAFWRLLYDAHADLVLNGHDHLYARYRPLDPSGNSDPRNGIREFIVGTGGETLDTVVTANSSTADPTANPNFNAENLETGTQGGEFWGVMGLRLDKHGYAWDFESALKDPAQTAGGATYSDTGVGTCHGHFDGDDR